MLTNRIVALALLVAGALLLYFGYTASQGIGDQLHEAFTGRFTEPTVWYLVLGAASSVAGICLLVFRGRA